MDRVVSQLAELASDVRVLLLVAAAIAVAQIGVLSAKRRPKIAAKAGSGGTTDESETVSPYMAMYGKQIEPVGSDFDWSATKPRPYRPFKPGKYHMTMGIRRLDPTEWLLIEDTYKDITDLRASIVEKHRKHTVLYNPMATEALRETYDTMLRFMMERYPQYFHADPEDPKVVVNALRGTRLHAHAADFGDDIGTMVRTAASNFEEDFLLLLPNEETGKYYLRGGSFAFPSGFDPAEKLDLELADVHGPVPLYKDTIGASMDRYFARMKVGQWVERFNWSIQTHTQLYAPALNHADDNVELKPLALADLDFDKVFLRVERQILTRLPVSKALIFTIRTYATPLTQVKAEGLGPDLATAIDGLPEPLVQYKKAREWGPAVQEFLRA